MHPSFTEPEAALRAAGHAVDRVVLDAAVRRWCEVPDDADLVVVGNPTNPTGVLHDLAAAVPARAASTVVDEAFLDAVPGEPGSLAGRGDLPGLVVVRSLTKTWALAGLRVGYLLAAPELVAALREAQPLWAVSHAGARRAGGLPHARGRRRGRARRRRVAAASGSGSRAAARARGRGHARVAGAVPALPRRRAVPTSARGCASSASRSAAATPSRASAPTGSGSPCATGPPSDRLVQALWALLAAF